MTGQGQAPRLSPQGHDVWLSWEPQIKEPPKKTLQKISPEGWSWVGAVKVLMRGTRWQETTCGMALVEPGPFPGSQGTVTPKGRAESIRVAYTGEDCWVF